MVTEPVDADTSNSAKSIAVAPPFIEVRDVPLRVVVPVRLRVSACAVNILPAAPERGDNTMLPVVDPPRVKVLFLNDCIVDVEALRDKPFVVADSVAVGVPCATPVIANFALEVDDPPIAKSTVLFPAKSNP